MLNNTKHKIQTNDLHEMIDEQAVTRLHVEEKHRGEYTATQSKRRSKTQSSSPSPVRLEYGHHYIRVARINLVTSN